MNTGVPHERKSTVGIWTIGLDTDVFRAPGLYTWRLCEEYLAETNLPFQIALLHYRSWPHPLYQSAREIIVPRTPLLGQLYLRREKVDLVHLNGIPGRLMSASFHTLPPLTKKIATVHGNTHFFPEILRHVKVPRLMPQYERLTQMLAARAFDHVITVSHWLKQTLVEKLHIPETKISAIHHGVLPIFRQIPDEDVEQVLSKYNIRRPFILHVSNGKPKKNPHILLKAYSRLHRQNQDVQLVIVGKGWDRPEIVDQIDQLGLKDKVCFVGYLLQPEIVALYNGAELLVFPSLHETFGMPLVEAMACGCPIVTTNVTALPEVAGDAALLVSNPYDADELAEKIAMVLSNADLRMDLVKRGLTRASQFSWGKCAREVAAVYCKVLGCHTLAQ